MEIQGNAAPNNCQKTRRVFANERHEIPRDAVLWLVLSGWKESLDNVYVVEDIRTLVNWSAKLDLEGTTTGSKTLLEVISLDFSYSPTLTRQ